MKTYTRSSRVSRFRNAGRAALPNLTLHSLANSNRYGAKINKDCIGLKINERGRF
jgi:hypothetical protein